MGAGDDAAGAEEGDEEAWKYVEFLKDEVNEKVEVILQKTLYEARDKKGLLGLEETVSETMEQVMEIRESLLMRIKALRKDEIKTDPNQNIKQEQMLSEFRMDIMSILLKLVDKDAASIDKLKSISQDLLRFKMTISNEVMRLLMLPGNTVAPPRDDCTECDVLKEISSKIENLVKCADEEEGEDAAEQEQEEAAAPEEDSADNAEAGAECMPPSMYAMELIAVNELIDEEIKNLYNSLVTTTEEEKREKLFKKLQGFKNLRNTVDEMITKLMSETEDDKLKKLVKRSLGRVNSEVQDILSDCRAGCDAPGCESCGAEVLYEAIDKMKYYKTVINNTDDEEATKETIRSDVIKYINEINNDARDILRKKATGDEIDDCEKEKSEVYKMIKSPIWMLVNTTIFSGMDELGVMVDTMIETLEELGKTYCSSSPAPPPPAESNCQWEEYEQTKEYLIKVDDIIQDALFKAKDDSQMTALLGFVDLQGLYDKRVKKLFEDELVCPEEVNMIKKGLHAPAEQVYGTVHE